jgi:hypothetical protein
MSKEKDQKFTISASPSQAFIVDVHNDDDKKALFEGFKNVILVHLRSQQGYEINDNGNEDAVIRPLGTVIGTEVDIDKYADIDTNFFSVYCTVRRTENGKIVKPAMKTAISLLLDEFVKYNKSATKPMNTVLFINGAEMDNMVLYDYAPDDIAQDIVEVITTKFGAESMSVIIGVDKTDVIRNRLFEFDHEVESDKKKKNKKKKKKK